MLYIHLLVTVLRSMLLPAAALRLENLALRQQLAILKPKNKRPRLRVRDRWFWVLLSRVSCSHTVRRSVHFLIAVSNRSRLVPRTLSANRRFVMGWMLFPTT